MDAEMFPVFQATLLWRMWLMPAEGWAGFLTPRPRREKLCPPGPGRAGRRPRPLGWPGYFLWHVHPTQEPARVLPVARTIPPRSQPLRGGQDRAGPPLPLASVGPESGSFPPQRVKHGEGGPSLNTYHAGSRVNQEFHYTRAHRLCSTSLFYFVGKVGVREASRTPNNQDRRGHSERTGFL